MKNLFVIILCLISLSSRSQPWVNVGAKWVYNVKQAFGIGNYPVEWRCISDTFVLGHNCSYITRDNDLVVGDVVNYIIAYEDSNKVYWLNPFTNQFSILYDFNANSGSSWNIVIDTCSYTLTVTDTNYININGHILKEQVFDFAYGSGFGMIEHIGFYYWPYPPVSGECTGAVYDYDYYDGIRCFEDSVIGFYNFGPYSNCYLYTGLSEPNEGELRIAPLPASDYLSIEGLGEFTSYNASMFSIQGKEVKNFKVIGNEKININDLAPGVYLLMLKQSQSSKVFKIMIE